MKIVTIVGARPQFVKAAVVSRALQKFKTVKEILVHTGQHYDNNMSDIFFKELKLRKPDYFLDINRASHGAMTGRMLERIEEILLKEKPDWAVVYGDTNSTLAGALAAKKLHIRLAHVEAGLRSHNMNMPEEINRILTDRISDLLFCPTETAVKNLLSEGYKNFDCKIIKCGDVMMDGALYFAKQSDRVNFKNEIENGKFILCTIHREENVKNLKNLKNIFAALDKINLEIPVVVVLHPNTKHQIEKNNLKTKVKTMGSVGYMEMIQLLKQCTLVMTDSGGLQKEAFFFKKNCVTLREETEWEELVTYEFNMIAGTDQKKIYSSYKKMISKKTDFKKQLYGNGKAGEKIAAALVSRKKNIFV